MRKRSSVSPSSANSLLPCSMAAATGAGSKPGMVWGSNPITRMLGTLRRYCGDRAAWCQSVQVEADVEVGACVAHGLSATRGSKSTVARVDILFQADVLFSSLD